jgi:hypothetical protein
VARERRKLAAILAADVVGYSRLMGRDESGTLARLCLSPRPTLHSFPSFRSGQAAFFAPSHRIIETVVPPE